MNLVLMHGIFGFGQIALVDYFNGVAQHLRQTFPGVNVLATMVDTTGIEQRARQAAAQIAAAFPSGPVHLIAHSMGGLDARFLITHDLENLQAKTQTLICLGTPHLGSPVATLLDRVTLFQSFSGSTAHAVRDLSETSATKFNAENPDVPSVRYFDVAGVGRNARVQTSVVFQPTHAFISSVAGRNDGLVSFTSATRGRTPAAVWPADHADLIGHDLNGPTVNSKPAFDYLSAYDALIRECINGKL